MHKAKIEPKGDGANMSEAFRAFRKDVKVRLEDLLKSIPGGTGIQACHSHRHRDALLVRTADQHNATAYAASANAPPAYDDLKRP